MGSVPNDFDFDSNFFVRCPNGLGVSLECGTWRFRRVKIYNSWKVGNRVPFNAVGRCDGFNKENEFCLTVVSIETMFGLVWFGFWLLFIEQYLQTMQGKLRFGVVWCCFVDVLSCQEDRYPSSRL